MNEAKSKRQLYLNGEWVEYELVRKNIKNLYLRVSAEGILKISAPKRLSLSEIERFIQKNAAFVQCSQEKMAAKINLAADFSAQGWVPFFGARLELNETVAAERKVCAEKQQLFISGESSAVRSKLLQEWLVQELDIAVNEACERIYPLFASYGVEYPRIVLRSMQARWGSCAVNTQTITLNKKLVHVPQNCIDYVVAHEFTHFLAADHSKNFYRLLEEMRPSWREERELLKQYNCRK